MREFIYNVAELVRSLGVFQTVLIIITVWWLLRFTIRFLKWAKEHPKGV